MKNHAYRSFIIASILFSLYSLPLCAQLQNYEQAFRAEFFEGKSFIMETADDGIIIIANTNNDTENEWPEYDIVLRKIDASGNIEWTNTVDYPVDGFDIIHAGIMAGNIYALGSMSGCDFLAQLQYLQFSSLDGSLLYENNGLNAFHYYDNRVVFDNFSERIWFAIGSSVLSYNEDASSTDFVFFGVDSMKIKSFDIDSEAGTMIFKTDQGIYHSMDSIPFAVATWNYHKNANVGKLKLLSDGFIDVRTNKIVKWEFIEVDTTYSVVATDSVDIGLLQNYVVTNNDNFSVDNNDNIYYLDTLNNIQVLDSDLNFVNELSIAEIDNVRGIKAQTNYLSIYGIQHYHSIVKNIPYETTEISLTQDVEILDVLIDELITTNPEVPDCDSRNHFLNGIQVIVKNNALETLTYLELNAREDFVCGTPALICGNHKSYLETFSDINIESGAIDTLEVPDLSFQYSEPILNEFCITASRPNKLIDSHTENDTGCYNFLISSTTDGFSDIEFTIHPNPATEFINVSYDQSIAGDMTWRLLDSASKVYNIQVSENVDISHLNSGLYIFEISLEGKTQVERFIKL